MDNSEKKENVYLAKWLNNELSDDDLKNIVSDVDFNAYIKIKNGIRHFEPPAFDEKKLRKHIEAQINLKKVKNKKQKKYTYFALAAAILLIFLVVYKQFLKSNYHTNFGEQKSFVLKDGSRIELNAKSSIKYKQFIWGNDRVVTLEGEAYFQVTPGGNFEVRTNNGKVNVIGTKFNVNVQKHFFSVSCYEGSVVVIQKNDTVFLTEGMAFQNNGFKKEQWHFIDKQPGWKQGESVFKSTPLHITISSLAKQFNIQIKYNNIDSNQLFTGSFPHDNLEIALKSVFIPMNIKYEIKNKEVFLYKN